MTETLPRYILATNEARAYREFETAKGFQEPYDAVRKGSLGSAAKVGDWYLAWGFTPSNTAARTVENILSMYVGQKSPPSRVFYLCYAGTHTSIVAGYIHLGILCPGGDPCGLRGV
ncbi:MAG: DUF3189 family protein [Bacillota bacterium]